MMMGIFTLNALGVFAQNKIDEERMQRDIEIAENIFQTLLRQEFGKRNFFPYEVDGSYMAGYGVTFRLPNDFNTPMGFMMMGSEPNIVINNGKNGSGSYSYSISGNGTNTKESTVVMSTDENKDDDEGIKLKRTNALVSKRDVSSNDSLRVLYNQRIIDASKTFLADYGDLIGQLAPEERITITNRGEGNNQRFWYGPDSKAPKRTMLTIDANKGDITQFKQGKLTRDQLIAKIKIVNTETLDELNPDLELLTSILSRLYEPDLSKTYYTQRDIYYERLKDYGVIYYMQVYSSNGGDNKSWNMPTLRLNDLDQEKRDAKVKELYPQFEKEIKENLLEYGKTLKSLKDEESVVINVKMTKCTACGIPSSLELSVKESVLKDYSSGKLTKDAALAKISVKKGVNQ